MRYLGQVLAERGACIVEGNKKDADHKNEDVKGMLQEITTFIGKGRVCSGSILMKIACRRARDDFTLQRRRIKSRIVNRWENLYIRMASTKSMDIFQIHFLRQ